MKNRQRIRRDERQNNPSSIRLTERDREIILAIYDYRYLSTVQLQRLFFPSMHQAYVRLSLLYHHGFIQRVFRGANTGKMNTSMLYVLDRRGAEFLQIDQDMEIHWNSSHRTVSDKFLEHNMAINDVRVSISLACKRTKEIALVNWINEAQLRASYDKVRILRSDGRRQLVGLIPDSFFSLEASTDMNFFLEVDMGSMTLYRFQKKIRAYLAYKNDVALKSRFGIDDFRVLTVTPSQRHMKHLKEATEEVGGKSLFWFTTLDNIVNSNELFNAPIWHKAGSSKLLSLLH
jgi:hypothetical protein